MLSSCRSPVSRKTRTASRPPRGRPAPAARASSHSPCAMKKARRSSAGAGARAGAGAGGRARTNSAEEGDLGDARPHDALAAGRPHTSRASVLWRARRRPAAAPRRRRRRRHARSTKRTGAQRIAAAVHPAARVRRRLEVRCHVVKVVTVRSLGQPCSSVTAMYPKMVVDVELVGHVLEESGFFASRLVFFRHRLVAHLDEFRPALRATAPATAHRTVPAKLFGRRHDLRVVRRLLDGGARSDGRACGEPEPAAIGLQNHNLLRLCPLAAGAQG